MKVNIQDEEGELAVHKKSTKTTTIHNNAKKITTLSKKLENIEYLIKIEQKNKKQLEEKYTKQISRVENQIEKYERDLENTLKELNEKESKIFEIQKNKLEEFKSEIQKYDNVYLEIEGKSKNVLGQLESNETNEHVLYNHSNMLYEDYLSYDHEVVLLKKKVIALKETLNEVEKTYPKEFEFLLEDIHLEKELNEISVKKKQFQEDIDNLEKNRKELLKHKENKSFEMKNLIDEIKKIEVSIESSRKDNHLIKLEDYIVKNINDMLIFDKMKILLQNYYNQKNFDLENELNVILIKNLNEKLKEMKNEFVTIKNEKMLNKTKIEEFIKILNNNKNSVEKQKIENEIQSRQTELEHLNNDINLLELNCKKKETLFNKYIIVLRNKCKKSAQESYYEMNPALIIETEFEEKFKEEILKNIEKDTKFTEEEKIKNKSLVDIFFKELINREKILQNSFLKKKKTEDSIENLNKDIEKLEENLQICEGEINNKKQMINELNTKERIFFEKIEARNRNMTNNFEQLGENEFEKYIKSNDEVLKNMKKIYGNKVLDKVFKVQKQKFLENVIMDHSFKKKKVNDYIQFVTKFESILDFYNSNINELENSYKLMTRKYQEILEFKRSKFKENTVLDESKTDLKEKIEMILSSHLKEIELEKKQLQYKFNINYYIEKIKDIGDRINECTTEKQNLLTEYENFNNVIHEKEKKLYIEDLDLKNNLISLSMGVNEENNPNTVMPYKVNKSYDSASNQKVNYLSDNDTDEDRFQQTNFDDMLKKSLAEYNSRVDSIAKDEFQILDDVLRSDDDLKKTSNSYQNIYNNTKRDQFLSLAIEKIKPLVNGLNLYKKFNSNSMNKKVFDPLKSNENPPENCGFALRIFRINTNEEILEIKNPKTKNIEQKISLLHLKGILLANSTKTLIKQKKTVNVKPNQDLNKLINGEYIPFNLLLVDGSLELLSQNYQNYKIFENALEEIVKNKKNLFGILKYAEN